MPTGTRVTPSQVDHYWALRSQDFSMKRASLAAGFSLEKAKDLERKRRSAGATGLVGASSHRSLSREGGVVSDWAIQPEHWSDKAQEAMADLTGARFMKRYWGMTLSPWQQHMWRTLEELWESPDREYVCVNAPPGLGKSTVLVGFASKRTVENRAVRGLFMSRAHSLAERNVRRLRRGLERSVPFLDAETTLAVDFGRFRSRVGELWRAHEFVVEQMDGAPIEEKEPTWAAFGFDAEWLGNRLDILIGDDLDSSRTVRNMETVEGNQQVFDNELEPRVEAGGLMCIAQQRLGAFDFSSHALSKQVFPDDDVENDDPEGEPKYRHVIFKAHYEDRCQGKETHRIDAPPWPDGCLLDPRQMSWRDMRVAMQNRRMFELVYQQNDQVAETGLVKQVWIDGGLSDGVFYPGCWDEDRQTWELPGTVNGNGNTLSGTPIGVITCDPSPSNYWSIQAWVVHRDSNQRFLLDMVREKMEAPEFLDWSSTMNCFTGVLEDWSQNFRKLGVDLSWVIVEINAAQRFMLQYDHFHRWMRTRGVQVVAHSTQKNKADPEFGIQMLPAVWMQGLCRLPAGRKPLGIRGNRLHSVNRLINEVTRYPHSATTDCVMAQWFLEYNIDKLYSSVVPDMVPQWRPSWLNVGS